ncbi:hypothetical protein AA313_de0208940 [Arthrobotrys entomopaga]|nr:hypothetical protein AA313_de0208940 [Arthrobotrys entomopaga]
MGWDGMPDPFGGGAWVLACEMKSDGEKWVGRASECEVSVSECVHARVAERECVCVRERESEPIKIEIPFNNNKLKLSFSFFFPFSFPSLSLFPPEGGQAKPFTWWNQSKSFLLPIGCYDAAVVSREHPSPPKKNTLACKQAAISLAPHPCVT